MQALILAAGLGKRLKPLTEKMPKSLIEVNGKPILINILDHLSGRDIHEVLLVVGDKKDIIINSVGHFYKNMKITYIENPIFDKTNNVYSFWLAKNYIHEDLLMLECDLFFNRHLIDIILQGMADCNILVSRFDKHTMDGSVVEIDNEYNVKSLIIKKFQNESFDFSDKMKTVNIYFFRKKFIIDQFLPMLELYVKTQSVNSYYELVLGALIYFKNADIKAVEIDATEWCEIDNMADLNRAAMSFKIR